MTRLPGVGRGKIGSGTAGGYSFARLVRIFWGGGLLFGWGEEKCEFSTDLCLDTLQTRWSYLFTGSLSNHYRECCYVISPGGWVAGALMTSS